MAVVLVEVSTTLVAGEVVPVVVLVVVAEAVAVGASQ